MDIIKLPTIGYSQIWKYLIEEVELRKQLSVEKPIVKGYNFFKSGKVLGIYTQIINNRCYIKSQVMPSYAKSGAAYTVRIIVNSSGDIEKAHCPCPAGVDGRCNHLVATLFAVEDKQRNFVNETENISSAPCTSKPCKWSVPPKKKCQPTAIQDVSFTKHVFKNQEAKPRRKRMDRTPLTSQSNHDFNDIYNKLKELEQRTGKKIGLIHTIPNTCFVSTAKIADEEPKQPQIKMALLTPIPSIQPLSIDQISQKASRVKRRLFESVNDREEIAQLTLQQQTCRLWYDVRQPRITASQCKRCMLRETTSPSKAIAEILMYKGTVQTQAMKDGIDWEPKIIQRFMEITNHKVRKSGFIVSESHPFLGASPDGITEDEELVEVKKVLSKENENLSSTICRLGIYKHDLKLNTNHKYYYQIQQQLFCTKLQLCHFIVSNGDEIHCDMVTFNPIFWEQILPKLESFYFNHILPELVYPRIKFGATRWNSQGLQFPRFD